jgi:4-hydroxysphinganine ceramide fatty acyl 2-hydroxylase
LADYNRNKFLDLNKPLLMQVWRANFTKEYYLSQVHNPRHLKEPARLFGNSFLEVSFPGRTGVCDFQADVQSFTRTQWYVVPLVWGPITAFLFTLSLMQFDDR